MREKLYNNVAKVLQEQCHLDLAEKLAEITKQRISATKEIDLERVQAFKTHIDKGLYTPNCENIAAKMLTYEPINMQAYLETQLDYID